MGIRGIRFALISIVNLHDLHEEIGIHKTDINRFINKYLWFILSGPDFNPKDQWGAEI